jgi:STE24 endopeptidase
MRRLTLTAALAAPVVAARLVARVLRPRKPAIEPLPVRAEDHFAADDLARARAFRRPQPAFAAAGMAVDTAVLVAVLRRPGLLPRRAGPQGAAVSLLLTAAGLPLAAASRRRAMRAGLITQSWGGWAGDVAKSSALGGVFAAAGAETAAALERRFGDAWWLGGAGAAAAAAALQLVAGPLLLEPLFNTFTPLPEGELRDDVMALADRAGVRVRQVFSVDASRRTTAINAYVTGLGPAKRVVFFDTLLDDYPRDQIRLVVAHELGHVRHRDVPRLLGAAFALAPPVAFAVSRLAAALDGGDERRRVPALALALGAVTMPVTFTLSTMIRAIEARTDVFALELTGEPQPLIDFHRGVAVRNLADPDPPAWRQRLLGTHPTPVERIGIAQAYATTTGMRER